MCACLTLTLTLTSFVLENNATEFAILFRAVPCTVFFQDLAILKTSCANRMRAHTYQKSLKMEPSPGKVLVTVLPSSFSGNRLLIFS